MPKRQRRRAAAASQVSGTPDLAWQDAPAGLTLAAERMRPAASPATTELEPVILPLQAAEADLREDRIEAAWVELDIAEARLRFQSSQPGTKGPVLEKTLKAVERTRDDLGRAQTRQACATLAAAVLALLAA